MSSRSSSRSSKPASIAKSSPSSGSSFSLTSLTVISKVASRPCQLLTAVLVREFELQRPRVPRRSAQHALLEPGDQVARSELHELVAPLAPGERLEARVLGVITLGGQRAHVVDHDEVAVLGGTLGGGEPGQTLAHALDLLLDALLVGGRIPASHLEVLVGAELRLRQHADLNRELERLSLGRQISQIQLGVPHGHDARGADRVGVPGGQRVPDGFLEHHLAAHPLEDQRSRDLALAEAGKLQLPAELACLALEAGLDLSRRNLDLQTDARVLELGDGGLQAGWHLRHDTVPPNGQAHSPRFAQARGGAPAHGSSRASAGRRTRPARRDRHPPPQTGEGPDPRLGIRPLGPTPFQV